MKAKKKVVDASLQFAVRRYALEHSRTRTLFRLRCALLRVTIQAFILHLVIRLITEKGAMLPAEVEESPESRGEKDEGPKGTP
jgi:hypothetical protein